MQVLGRSVFRAWSLALMASVAACSHSAPFAGEENPGVDGPFSTTALVRLTFDAGMDRYPTFDVDNQSFWYSFQAPGRPDGDRCLATMAAAGGVRHEHCLDDNAGQTRRDAYDSPTPGPDGQLAYGRFQSLISAFFPASGALMLATTADPLNGRSLLTTPNNIGGVGFNHFGRIRWIAKDKLLVLIEDQTVVPHCIGCVKRDTVIQPYGILGGTITATGATFALIPGTNGASDFFTSAAGDSIYFTNGDLLQRLPTAGGTPVTVFTNSTGVGSVARVPGGMIFITSDGRIRLADFTAGTSVELVNRLELTALGFGAIDASSDGCRAVVEVRKSFDVTYTTDLYGLKTGKAGCTP